MELDPELTAAGKIDPSSGFAARSWGPEEKSQPVNRGPSEFGIPWPHRHRCGVWKRR